MATNNGRSRVTLDMKITANAHLQNSEKAIKEFQSMIDKFDFGDKIDKQIVNAIDKLKTLNKDFNKIQDKTLINDNELKNFIKIEQEITKIVNKTKQLYSGFSADELQKYSKSYIAQVKKQEEEIARIKEEYNKKYNSNFDKDLSKMTEIQSRIKSLEKEITNLNNSKDATIANAIKTENIRLQEQFDLLQKINKTEQSLRTQRSNIIQNTSKETGFTTKELTSKVNLNEDVIAKDISNQKYQQILNTFQSIGKEREEILNSGKNEKQIQNELINLAKKYNLENVKTTNEFENQFKVLEKQKNFYRSLNNRQQLVTEQEITNELERRKNILDAQRNINQEILNSSKQILAANNFNSVESMQTQKKNAQQTLNDANVIVTNTGASLSADGEDTISTNITTSINGATDKINNTLTSLREIFQKISETNQKIATQSDRTADEQDLKNIGAENKQNFTKLNSELNNVENNVNTYTNKDNSRIAGSLLNAINPIVNIGDLSKLSTRYISDVDYDVEKIGKEYPTFFGEINQDFQKISTGKINVNEVKDKIIKENEVISSIFNIIEHNIKNTLDQITEDMLDLEAGARAKGGGDLTKNNLYLSLMNEFDDNMNQLAVLQKMKKDSQNDFNELNNRINLLNGTNPFPQISSDVRQTSKEFENAAQKSQFLGSVWDDLGNRIGYFLSLNYVFDQMTRKITEAITTVREMDKDMTQIGLVLGKTAGQVWDNFDTYSNMAERLNTTTSDVTQSMKLFYQQGLNTSEVNKMVEASAIAAALGESTMADASETLTSILNSYNLSASKAMEVTDKISQIAIVSAADFGELSTAIEKVASSASSAGLDLDHMMGYLAKMIETTREAPTNIGTALKTIVANFTQFKEDPSGLTEEGSEINKVDTALKSVGISLTDTTGEVRDLGNVLDDLGKIWETLNRNQRSYLATQIAGTRQQSRFYALMNDYDRTLELVAEGSNSAGKAQQQFALYSNSLEASTNRLTNQWEKFFNSITRGNSLIVNITNSLTNFMKVLNAIGPIGTVLGLTAFIKNSRSVVNQIARLNEVIKNQSDRNTSSKIEQDIINNDSTLGNDEKQRKIQEIKNRYILEETQELSQLTKIQKEYVTNAGKIKKTINDINNSFATQKGIIPSLQKNYKKLGQGIKYIGATAKVTFAEIKVGLSSLMTQFLVFAGINLLFKGLSAAAETVSDALNLNTKRYVENAEKAEENKETVSGLLDEYKELSEKTSLTSDERERLNEITEEAVEIDSELGNQLKLNGDNYKANIDLMENYIDKQKKINAENTKLAGTTSIAWGDSSTLGGRLANGIRGGTVDFFGTWTDVLGSEEQKQQRKAEGEQAYRNITTGSINLNDLTEEQSSMVNLYSEQLINLISESSIGLQGFTSNVYDFSEAIDDFIEKIKNLTNAESAEYSDLLQKRNDDSVSMLEYWNSIKDSNLPEEIKSVLQEEFLQTQKHYQEKLTDNDYMTATGKENAKIASVALDKGSLNNLIKPEGFESLTEEEQKQYKNTLANIFNDDKLFQQLIVASQNGAEGINAWISSLGSSIPGINLFKETLLQGVTTVDQALENAKTSLESFKETIEDTIFTGKFDQLDLLDKILNNKIALQDINYRKDAFGNTKMYASFDSTLDTAYAQAAQILAPFTQKIKGLEQQKTMYTDQQSKVNMAQQEKDAQQSVLDDYNNQKNNLTTRRELLEQQLNLTNKYNTGQVLGNRVDGKWYKETEASFDSFEQKDQYYKLSEQTGLTNQKDIAKEIKNIKSQEDNLTQSIEKQQTAVETANKNYEDEKAILGELNDKNSDVAKTNKEVVDSIDEEIAATKKHKDAIEEILTQDLDRMSGLKAVFESFQISGQTEEDLNRLSEAWKLAEQGGKNYYEVASAIANDPSLIECLDMESQYLEFSKSKLEEKAKAAIKSEMEEVDSKIAGTEAILAMIDTRIQGGQVEIDQEGENNNTLAELMGKAIGYNESLNVSEENTVEQEAVALSTSIQNWAQWGTEVQKAIAAADATRAAFVKNTNANSESAVTATGVQANTNGIVSSIDLESNIDSVEANKNKGKEFADMLNSEAYNPKTNEGLSNLKKLKDSYSRQLAILKKIKGSLQYQYDNAGSLMDDRAGISGGSGGGSGSEDVFEQQIEKLERFYNYLRQIEALEAKIEKIREKRNLIDATQNYYIKDLAEENKLLKEQSTLYGNYIKDQRSYLAELRSQISKQFKNWAYFDKEGVVQVKQTEFTINSEKEQERYDKFSELLDEYQNEYNTMLENQNTLYSIQSTIIENINTSYDKVLQKITDISESLEYINSISEHKVDMSFGSVEKLTILSDKIKTTTDMLLNAQSAVNGLESDMKKLQDMVKKSDFSSLLTWDNTQQKYFINNDKLNNTKIQQQFEKQGYNWEEIVTWVNAVAGASQKVTDSMKDTNEQLMSAREELKSILEDRLSTIDEIFDKATDEINKFYAIYEQKIGSLGTENELFGISSDNLDKQYNYLLTTAQHAKALLAGLEQNRQSILDTLMKDYGDYVEMVDGVAYINKMAIEESSTLTEGQKADLLQLYQIYADSQDQIDEVNEKFYDYISQIKELEETKRDAIIDLKNRLYNELIRIDQQEINDLSEKYQKMSQLDSEYYSKLQQRISDARNARNLLQNQQNLAQMQNRLAILQQDNSGQYNAELVELQRQINEQLQAQADQNIDLELERIAREQEERQEDREMQIIQMENLLTFKDENGMYWEQAQDIMNNGTASIIGKLMESDEYQKMSDEERQKALEELQDLTAQASAELSSGSEYITSNIREDLENLVKSPIEEIPAEIKTSSDTMVNQIKTATKTFINTMSALFKYLDELTGKNDANKWTSGILNNDGTYKMPTKKPAKKPTQSSSPSKNNSSKAPALKVGSYVDVKTGTKWYYDSYGTAPTGYARSGKIKYINLKGSKPYNIEGLGWIAKKDIVGYSTGGYVDYTGIAAVHGKTGKPEAFLNAKQTALFETLRDALIKVPKIDSSDSGNSETINIENLAINVKELADTDSIDKVVKTVKDSIYKDATSGNNMKISRRR